jgi:hypothetical protein
LWLRIKNPPRHDVHVSCDGSFLAAATDWARCTFAV